ncbi:MAG: response regulator [Rhodospirillales bacterium]|nr:response regulator [Rhodospirillales bacterium]
MANKTIRIVEDDVLHMKLFNDVLESRGYQTLRTTDADRTVPLARQHHPDLIIMDIQLPFISGLELLKRLKDENDLEDIPVIAVTVLADDWDEDEYLSYRFDAYLAKSIAISIFLNTVAGFFDPSPLEVHKCA